jgi:hypothetical protein
VAKVFSAELDSKRKMAANSSADDVDGSESTGEVASATTPGAMTDGIPAVVRAAADGEFQELQRLLSYMPSDMSKTVAEELDELVIVEGDDLGQNAMIKAVRNNHLRCAQLLLECGASPTKSDVKWRSAWYYACFGVNIPKGQHKAA